MAEKCEEYNLGELVFGSKTAAKKLRAKLRRCGLDLKMLRTTKIYRIPGREHRPSKVGRPVYEVVRRAKAKSVGW